MSMDRKRQLLREINAKVPPDVDWRRGAKHYVSKCVEKFGRDGVERYALTKPLAQLPSKNHAPALAEAVWYLSNFVNTIRTLDLPGGAQILDVGCGAGWLSHMLNQMGYRTVGFDIAEEFIILARRRLLSDTVLKLPESIVNRMFFVHDIEQDALPAEFGMTFDAIILDSCLHHFFDPISCLTHLASALAPHGLIIILEGENCTGPIKDEWQQAMRQYQTLERPYARAHLIEALLLAGLPEVEFAGFLNGFISSNDPAVPNLPEIVLNAANAMNFAICGKTKDALRRVFPWR